MSDLRASASSRRPLAGRYQTAQAVLDRAEERVNFARQTASDCFAEYRPGPSIVYPQFTTTTTTRWLKRPRTVALTVDGARRVLADGGSVRVKPFRQDIQHSHFEYALTSGSGRRADVLDKPLDKAYLSHTEPYGEPRTLRSDQDVVAWGNSEIGRQALGS